jgi:sporulation protein YlmC with PRC-barrel domain
LGPDKAICLADFILIGLPTKKGGNMAAIPRVYMASKIIGEGIKNPQGEDLGKIEDIMLDLNTGRIGYAILSFGGFLGVGNKLFAIPWSILKTDPDEENFILDVPKEMLKNAPGFDKDSLPDPSDYTWQERVYAHYEVSPYWKR